MVYLFAIPLLLGVVPQLIVLTYPKLSSAGSWQPTIHNFAIATLIVGFILRGVVEIYGTTSQYIALYFMTGFGLLAASSVLYFFKLILSNISYSKYEG